MDKISVLSIRTIGAFTLLSLLLSAFSLSAQTCMVSGVVLSPDNEIIPSATLKFTLKKESTEVRVSEDGMYYSPLLAEGSYLVDIYVGTVLYRAERLYLRCTGTATYYNYRLQGSKASLYTDHHYPLLLRTKAGEHVPQEADNK